MAAHSFLKVGGLWIFAYREWYSESLAAIFRDSENSGRIETPQFSLPAGQLRARLNVLGYTRKASELALMQAHAALLDSADGGGSDDDSVSFDEWLEANIAAATDDTASCEEVPSWVFGIDQRFALRRILDYIDPEVEVTLDLSEVVGRGFVRASGTICADALARDQATSTGPLVVLTEGPSDATAISSALDLLLPHLSGYIRFLDYTFKPEGSTSALVRAVRAFAAAGISNQIVALFDNDTAAAESLLSLDATTLPSNFRILRLPEIDLARRYPTIGPTGPLEMDVNGLAVSIELFMGADVLKSGDQYESIQWTGYSAKVGAYQGEIMGKAAIQSRYRDKVQRALGTGVEGQNWVEMRILLDRIASAFD